MATTKGSVIVRFLADSNIVQQLKKVASAGGAAVKKLRDKLNTLNSGLQAGLAKGFSIAKKAALAFGAALAGIIVLGARFEKQISEATAVAGGGMEELAAAAREAGATTAFTATQGAKALTNLARAGLGVQGSIDALNPVLLLAGANNLDLAFAAETTAATLKQFRLETDQTTRVADVFTATAASSNTAVEDLSEAMKMAGGVSKGFGLSVEKTLTFLGQMGDLGFRGSIAGTALTNSFGELSKVSEKSAKALQKYGLDADDVNPKIHQLDDIIHRLSQTAIESDEILELFGLRAGKPFIALIQSTRDQIKESGVANTKFNQLFNTISKSGGKAAAQYEAMMNNVSGQTRIAISKLEDLGLSIFDLFKADLTDALKDFNGWIEDNKGEIVAWAGTFLSSILDMAHSILDFYNLISPVVEFLFVNVATLAQQIWRGLKVIFNGLKAAVAGILVIISGAIGNWELILDSIPTETTREWARALKTARLEVDKVSEKIAGDALEGFEAIADETMDGVHWGEKMSGVMLGVKNITESLAERTKNASKNIKEATKQAGNLKTETKGTAIAMGEVSDEADEAGTHIETLAESLEKARGKFLDASSFEKMGTSLANAVSKGIQEATVAFDIGGGGLGAALSTVASGLSAALPMFGAILDFLINLRDFLEAILVELPATIKDTLMAIPKLIEENLADFVAFFMVEFTILLQKLPVLLAVAMAKAAVEIPAAAWDSATREWKNAWNQAKDVGKQVTDGLKDLGAAVGIGGGKKKKRPEWMKEIDRMVEVTEMLAGMDIGETNLQDVADHMNLVSHEAGRLKDVLAFATAKEFKEFIETVEDAREQMEKGKDLNEEQEKVMKALVDEYNKWLDLQTKVQEQAFQWNQTLLTVQSTLDGSNQAELNRLATENELALARERYTTLTYNETASLEAASEAASQLNDIMTLETELLNQDKEALLAQRDAWKEFAGAIADIQKTEVQEQLAKDTEAVTTFWDTWIEKVDETFEANQAALDNWHTTTMTAMDNLISAANDLAEVAAANEERARKLAEILAPIPDITTEDITAILGAVQGVEDLGGVDSATLDEFADSIIAAFEAGGIDEATFVTLAAEINRVGELIAAQAQATLDAQKEVVLAQLQAFDDGISIDSLSTDAMTTDMVRTMIEQGDLTEAQAAIDRLHADELARLEDERDWQIEALKEARDENLRLLQVDANAKLADIDQRLLDTHNLIDERFETLWQDRLTSYIETIQPLQVEQTSLLRAISENTALLGDLAGFQTGGTVPHTGLYTLHANETVLTPDQFTALTRAAERGESTGNTRTDTLL